MSDTDLVQLLNDIPNLMKKMEDVAFGSELQNVEHAGQQRPTLAKRLKEELNSRISALSALANGRVAVKNKADLPAAGSDQLYTVWGDAVAQNNGNYGWNGTAWEVTPFDDVRSGYRRNSGAVAPLQKRIRGGVESPASSRVNASLLDVTVIGAKPGKLYRIEWIGNNISSFGDGDKYAFLLAEYDEAGFAGSANAGKRDLQKLGDSDFDSIVEFDGVVTRHIKCARDETITFVISYIPGELATETILNVSSYAGYSWVIDPVNYIFSSMDLLEPRVSRLELKEDEKSNVLINMARDSSGQTESQIAIDAILDIKIFGAKPGKLYRIEWLGNGVTLSNEKRYELLLDEYDAGSFLSDSSSGRRNIIKLGDVSLPNPSGEIVERVIRSVRDDSIGVYIKYDSSRITSSQLVLNSGSLSGYGQVINPENYSEKLDSDLFGSGDLLVRHHDGKVSVIGPHGDERILLSIARGGCNSLMALYQYACASKATGFTGSWRNITGGGTDWIGPWSMRAVNNGNGNPVGWSGGTHDATSSGTSGAPSAETELYEVKVDGRDFSVSDHIRSCGCVEVSVKNLVSAHNTVAKAGYAERRVLVERVLYRIESTPESGISVSVHLEAEPLEDLEIHTYYGMQALLNGMDEYWFPNCQQTERWSKGVNIDAGNKISYPDINRFVGVTTDKKYSVVGYLDTGFGLAKNGRPMVPDNESLGKASTYSKTYHQLIGQAQQIGAGEIMEWRGAYYFSPGNYVGSVLSHQFKLFGNNLVTVESEASASAIVPCTEIGASVKPLEVASHKIADSVGAFGVRTKLESAGGVTGELE